MSFDRENVKRWLLKEIAESGAPRLFWWAILDVIEEIKEDGLLAVIDAVDFLAMCEDQAE